MSEIIKEWTHEESIKKFIDAIYEPLPHNVTIKESNFNGMGLFSKTEIPSRSILGKTHVAGALINRREWVETPFGIFINHSENPNCYILNTTNERTLCSIKPIKTGEELTVYDFTFSNRF